MFYLKVNIIEFGVCLCTHVSVWWPRETRLREHCAMVGTGIHLPLGHYCIFRGHAHSHTHGCIKFVIALKARDKPKNSMSLLSLRKSHTHRHTQKTICGLPKGLSCKPLILAMTLSLDLSFDCPVLNSDCHCCHTILQAIRPNGTTDTYAHANRHGLLTYM